MIYASKNELFPVKFRRISEVFFQQDIQKKFWAQFHELCVQQWSCLPWRTDVFWTLYACKVYRKSFGCIVTIFASKNKAVCLEVQTHFGSSLRARFAEKVLGAISRFVCHANRHSWLQHFGKVLWARFTILQAHTFLLCCWDTLWSSWLSHFVIILWIWTHLGCECTHKLWRTSVTLCEALWNKSWTDTWDMFCIIWTSKEWTDFVNIDLR